jgi:outer membrane protein OmpA-like peptidoglycan-associated protein
LRARSRGRFAALESCWADKGDGAARIVINVHSDASGENAANLALSKKRAHAVVAWLVAHGPEHQPHFVKRGYGSTRPVAPKTNADGSDNMEGPQQNRRIEILLRRN